MDMWFSWAGSPSDMLVDPGTQINPEELTAFAQANNIKLTTTSTEAQFQNGKAERHGAVLKAMLSRFDTGHPIKQPQEFCQAFYWCTRAKNAKSLKRSRVCP